jgi:hypothetical protein
MSGRKPLAYATSRMSRAEPPGTNPESPSRRQSLGRISIYQPSFLRDEIAAISAARVALVPSLQVLESVYASFLGSQIVVHE